MGKKREERVCRDGGGCLVLRMIGFRQTKKRKKKKKLSEDNGFLSHDFKLFYPRLLNLLLFSRVKNDSLLPYSSVDLL